MSDLYIKLDDVKKIFIKIADKEFGGMCADFRIAYTEVNNLPTYQDRLEVIKEYCIKRGAREMKITQVQLWIEVCPFFKETFIKFSPLAYEMDEEQLKLHGLIYEKIKDKFEKPYYKLKQNESRESIIEALKNYQESLLPKDLYFDFTNFTSKNHNNILNTRANDYDSSFICRFYNCENRIITLTKFEEVNE
jgi:hypothetical protein